MEKVTAELVASRLRGEAGTPVGLVVRHKGSGSSGGRAEERLALTRAAVKVMPVESAQVKVARSAAAAGGGGEALVGVVTVPSFSQETSAQLIEAVRGVRPGAAALAVRFLFAPSRLS